MLGKRTNDILSLSQLPDISSTDWPEYLENYTIELCKIILTHLNLSSILSDNYVYVLYIACFISILFFLFISKVNTIIFLFHLTRPFFTLIGLISHLFINQWKDTYYKISAISPIIIWEQLFLINIFWVSICHLLTFIKIPLKVNKH